MDFETSVMDEEKYYFNEFISTYSGIPIEAVDKYIYLEELPEEPSSIFYFYEPKREGEKASKIHKFKISNSILERGHGLMPQFSVFEFGFLLYVFFKDRVSKL